MGQVKDEIFTTVVGDGWSEAAGAFTQYFGSEDLDASNLMLPIVGFLPATHPRMKATIDADRRAPHRRARPGLPVPDRGRCRRPRR